MTCLSNTFTTKRPPQCSTNNIKQYYLSESSQQNSQINDGELEKKNDKFTHKTRSLHVAYRKNRVNIHLPEQCNMKKLLLYKKKLDNKLQI